MAIQDSVVAAEKKSGSGAAIGMSLRDCHLGSGARVLLYNTTISVTVTNGDGAGGRGLHLLESPLSNGASASIAKSNITVKVSGTSSANAMAFAFESGPFTGQATQISFIDTVIEVTAITGAGYGLRVANAVIAGGAALDVQRCNCTIRAVRSAVLFIRETLAQVTGRGTRISFIEVNAIVTSSANTALGVYCLNSETTNGAALLVIGSNISVTSEMEAVAWHFAGGSPLKNSSLWLIDSTLHVEVQGGNNAATFAVGWFFKTPADEFSVDSGITVASSSVRVRSTVGSAIGWYLPAAGVLVVGVIAVVNSSSITVTYAGGSNSASNVLVFYLGASAMSAAATFVVSGNSRVNMETGSFGGGGQFVFVSSTTTIIAGSALWWSADLFVNNVAYAPSSYICVYTACANLAIVPLDPPTEVLPCHGRRSPSPPLHCPRSPARRQDCRACCLLIRLRL